MSMYEKVSIVTTTRYSGEVFADVYAIALSATPRGGLIGVSEFERSPNDEILVEAAKWHWEEQLSKMVGAALTGEMRLCSLMPMRVFDHPKTPTLWRVCAAAHGAHLFDEETKYALRYAMCLARARAWLKINAKAQPWQSLVNGADTGVYVLSLQPELRDDSHLCLALRDLERHLPFDVARVCRRYVGDMITEMEDHVQEHPYLKNTLANAKSLIPELL